MFPLFATGVIVSKTQAVLVAKFVASVVDTIDTIGAP